MAEEYMNGESIVSIEIHKQEDYPLMMQQAIKFMLIKNLTHFYK